MNLQKISNKFLFTLIIVISVSVSIVTSVYINQYLERYLQSLNLNLAFENRFVSGSRALPGSYAESLEAIRNIDKQSGVNLFRAVETARNQSEMRVVQSLAKGVVLSADGWLIFPDLELGTGIARPEQFYVEQNKVKYQVLEIRNEPARGLAYVKVAATGLVPISFARTQEFLSGDQVVIMSATQLIQPASILSVRGNSLIAVDDFARADNWKLNGSVLPRSIAFNTAGQFVGFVNGGGEVLPVHRFAAELRSFLSQGLPKIPTFGVKTLDLTAVSNLDISNYSRLGSLIVDGGIVPGSPAEMVGLRSGDVITAINGRLLRGDLTLSEILQEFVVGDDIRVTFVRDGVEQTLVVNLNSAN
jgi:hypothetical protein